MTNSIVTHQVPGIPRLQLGSNECALGPSPAAVQAVIDAAPLLHRYPRDIERLRDRIADHVAVPRSQVAITNGSSDALIRAMSTLIGDGDHGVVAEPTFVLHGSAIEEACGTVTRVPTSGFRQDIDTMLAAVTGRTRVIVLSNPHNPTGSVVSHDELTHLLDAVPAGVTVVVDEAYREYARDTDAADSIRFLEHHQNLLVTRTFSKAHGLAALRLGYAVGSPSLINRMNDGIPRFYTGRLAIDAAIAALGDTEHQARVREANRASLEILEEGFTRLGLRTVPSHANFLLVTDLDDPDAVAMALERRHGAIVRPTTEFGLPGSIRVTTGTVDETRQIVALFELALEELDLRTR